MLQNRNNIPDQEKEYYSVLIQYFSKKFLEMLNKYEWYVL